MSINNSHPRANTPIWQTLESKKHGYGRNLFSPITITLSEQTSDRFKCPLNISLLVTHEKEKDLNTSVILTVYAQWGSCESRHMADVPKVISLGYPYGFICFEVSGSLESSMEPWCVLKFDLQGWKCRQRAFEVKRRCKLKTIDLLRLINNFIFKKYMKYDKSTGFA